MKRTFADFVGSLEAYSSIDSHNTDNLFIRRLSVPMSIDQKTKLLPLRRSVSESDLSSLDTSSASAPPTLNEHFAAHGAQSTSQTIRDAPESSQDPVSLDGHLVDVTSTTSTTSLETGEFPMHINTAGVFFIQTEDQYLCAARVNHGGAWRPRVEKLQSPYPNL